MPPKSESKTKAKARAAATVVESVPSDPVPVIPTINDNINNVTDVTIEVPMSDTPALVIADSTPSASGPASLPALAMILIAGIAYSENDLRNMKRSQVLALLEQSDEEIDQANAGINETIAIETDAIRVAENAIQSWTVGLNNHIAALDAAKAGLRSKDTLVFQVAKSLGLTQEERTPVKAATVTEGRKRRASSEPKAPKRTDTDELTLRCFSNLDEVADGLAVETIKTRLKLQGVDSSAARSLWCVRLCARSADNKSGRAKNAILVGRNDQFGKMTIFSLNDAGRAAHRELLPALYTAPDAEGSDQEP